MFGLGELKNVEVHTAGTVCVHGRKNCRVTDDRERGLPGGTMRGPAKITLSSDSKNHDRLSSLYS